MGAILYRLGWWVVAGMVFIAVPVFTIWAINLLTGSLIPYTFFNWLATLWLVWLARGNGRGPTGGME